MLQYSFEDSMDPTWLFQTDSILLDIMVFSVTGLVCFFVFPVGLGDFSISQID